jgi:hypothetical protein
VTGIRLDTRWAAALVLLCAIAARAEAPEPREVASARIFELTAIDRLILANARAKLAADPKVEQRLDDFMYELRKPGLWNASHPAWAPTRAALRDLVARESNAWIETYWKDAMKVHVREIAYAYRLPDILVVQEFAESPGGRAYFAQRVAEARAKAGEAMFSLDPATPAALRKLAQEARTRFDKLPAAEKQRVAAFTAAASCGACTHGTILEMLIRGQSDWIAGVLVSHLGDVHYETRDVWRRELDTKFASVLPVDSKKQLLGSLELRDDASLVFRFTFYWNDAADGGKLALEIPKSAPYYAETLALAPGLTQGRPRVLYRDKDGVVSDKP